jgi:hypothetical protein
MTGPNMNNGFPNLDWWKEMGRGRRSQDQASRLLGKCFVVPRIPGHTRGTDLPESAHHPD